MFNKASKVDAILNAWFDYIALDDYGSARIEAANQNTVKQRDVKLVRDHVLIEPATFSELQHKQDLRNCHMRSLSFFKQGAWRKTLQGR